MFIVLMISERKEKLGGKAYFDNQVIPFLFLKLWIILRMEK